ncbi:cell wall integrity and stress response component [Microdochium nivale]|nr:cell wall integrity and stress response component [Microdochium nivale]
MAPLQHLESTSSTLEAASRSIVARQATTTVVTQPVVVDNGNSLSGGEIAGIVIGSIVGFLLICWIIRACVNWGRPGDWGTTFEPDYEKPARRRRSHDHRYVHETHVPRSRSRHSHRSHRSHHSPRRSVEMRDVYVTRETQRVASRGRSPRAPPAVYQVRPEANARDSRRASRSSRY